MYLYALMAPTASSIRNTHTTPSTSSSLSRPLFSKQCLVVILALVLAALLISPASAQSPPGPQPGSGVDPSLASADSNAGNPAKTMDANRPTPAAAAPAMTITPIAGAAGATTPTVPQPPSVTVINGTTITLTATLAGGGAAPVGAAPQQPFPATSALPKAPQSILIVQSTTYGKILPAAGPADDQIESHFWDQFTNGPKKSSAPPSSPSQIPPFSLSQLLPFACTILVCFAAAATSSHL